MNLQKKTKKFLCQVILERTGEPGIFSEEECEALLRREAIDWLFIFLGVFTYIYLALTALVFFGKFAANAPNLFFVLDSLQEAYLGALGIYVILKEIRKRRSVYPSRYWGELFVALWFIFLLAATAFVIFLPQYSFDSTYKLILTNSLVVGMIYLGGVLNKP